MRYFLNFFKLIKNNSIGSGNLNHIIWLWGGFVYVLCFIFLFDLHSKIQSKTIFLITISLLVFYFFWHIFITIKNSPKIIKSKEEKNLDNLKNGGKLNTFMRKLFLQEPIFNSKPTRIVIVIDIFFIVHYLSYI